MKNMLLKGIESLEAEIMVVKIDIDRFQKIVDRFERFGSMTGISCIIDGVKKPAYTEEVYIDLLIQSKRKLKDLLNKIEDANQILDMM